MIRAKTPQSDIIIDLDGPDGNAFQLLAYAKKLAHHKGMRASPIMSEMCSGTDYWKLVKIFDKHFGDLVVLESSDRKLMEFVNAD
jgi:hypothetical protein|tara:strand:- start:438 stop:692 length:255 start_codon:yes stop_codon:yes gene_type:complete